MAEFTVYGRILYKIADYDVHVLTLNKCLYKGYLYENSKLVYVTDVYVLEEDAVQVLFNKIKSFLSLKGIITAL